jgi:hypothetical protein
MKLLDRLLSEAIPSSPCSSAPSAPPRSFRPDRRGAGNAEKPFALALFLALSACRSAGPIPEGSPLPFHVALIPTEVHDTSVLTATPSEPVYPERVPGGTDDDMRLELTTADVSQTLARELGRAFVRTTLLELPEGGALLAGLSPLERERFWQERARAAGADLLVRTRLLVDPAIAGERNEKFWLNVPLWLLLGGPLSWFVGDRSYGLSARLQAEVFDTSEGHESLSDYALLQIPLYAEFRGADLNLIDRADGLEDYALSILVPAGLLARETSEVEEELEQRLPVELGRELARKVFAERTQFEQNLALEAFKLEVQAASLERGAEGRVRVRVPVQELAGAGALHRYELRAGQTVLASRDFRGAAGDGRRFIEDELTSVPSVPPRGEPPEGERDWRVGAGR